MIFQNPYWSERTRIELLEKWLIIHSLIYYDLDTNIVDDAVYDANCKQLQKFIVKYSEAFRESKWYYIFKEFEGSGFYISKKLRKKEKSKLIDLAEYLIREFVREKERE